MKALSKPASAVWTEQETNFLLEHYRDMPVREIANNLKRTVPSVERKAARLGLSKYNIERVSREEYLEGLGRALDTALYNSSAIKYARKIFWEARKKKVI